MQDNEFKAFIATFNEANRLRAVQVTALQQLVEETALTNRLKTLELLLDRDMQAVISSSAKEQMRVRDQARAELAIIAKITVVRKEALP